MEKKYSKALFRANILFGVHCIMKGILILLLFIILYSIIWIEEKNLNFIKISVYIQLLIFLFIIAVILFTNNPNLFDMCLKCILYIFLILSILQIITIILELFGIIQNFNIFIKFFHECPYYRTYNDIIDSKYQRICLFYKEDPYSEEPFKYLCYYNSEEEYYNKFCDGLICKQNNNFYKNENDFIKCSGININLITFPDTNVFFQKEKLLFDKKKNKKFYLCSRKKRIDEYKSDDDNDDDSDKLKNNNIECPDNNPSKKYIIFIYIDLLFHILIDFIFIYEIFVFKNLNNIYFDMNENSKLKINRDTTDNQSNGSNNKVNNPSVNQVITIIDKRKENNQSENSEDIKIEESSKNNNNENNKKRNIKMDMNDNRYINISQNMKICKNTNSGSILLIGLNPKNKGKLKNKGLKSKESAEDENYLYIKNKKHNKLKSSQLQHLINISNDNDEHNQNNQNSSNEENNNNIKINNKKNRTINIINKDINNYPKINKNILIREIEKNNKTTYGKNKINFNFNINEKYFHIPINNKIKINNNNKKEKIKKQQNESFDFNLYKKSINHSFDLKQNLNKENTYIPKINRNIINDYNNDNDKNMNQNIIERSNNEILSNDDNYIKKETNK